MNTNIVPGSVAAIAQDSKRSVAETFADIDVLVICDTSSSMSSQDSSSGRSRYEQACLELQALQKELPGKIGVMSFSDKTVFCPGGVPEFLAANTNLAGALTFAKVNDIPGSGIRFILISDGEPDDEAAALAVATTYHNRIDVIFVGPELHAHGRQYLQQLSKTTGGQTVTANQVAGMAQEVQKLLATG